MPPSEQPPATDQEPNATFDQRGQTVYGPQTNIAGNLYTGDAAYDVRGLTNPYLGLKAFTYAERALYAGRDPEIAHALTLLTTPGNERTLLFITGASGSGKSSFAQAGLIPALKQHYEQSNPVVWAIFRPGPKPLAALVGALRILKLPATGLFAPAAPYQVAPPASLAPDNQLSLLLIDQFEEIFSQSDAAERDAIFTLLAHLPPFRDLHMHIIATLRADYLPDLFSHPVLYDQAKAGIDLRVMDARQIELAIQRPLQVLHPQGDKRFQTTLLNRLAADTAEDAAYLPLLQVTLEELWRGGLLTIDAYTSLTAAISQRADAIFAYTSDAAGNSIQRSSDEQVSLLQIFLALVDVSPDGDQRRDVRRTQRLADLTRGQLATESLIRELATARLLSTGEKPLDPGGQPTQTVDIIHESLIHNWERLQQAIQTAREHLQQRRRFELHLAEWRSHAQSTAYLLSGVYLAEAEQLRALADVSLQSPDAKTYLVASTHAHESQQQAELARQRALAAEQVKRAEAEAERAEVQTAAARQLRRRAWWLTGVAVLALIAAIVALWFFNDARDQTRLAKAGELAASAGREIAQPLFDPSLALLLASRAVTMTQPSDGPVFVNAANALADVVQQTQFWRATLTDKEPHGIVRSAAFSGDGRRILTAHADGYFIVWNATTGRALFSLPGHNGLVMSVAFSADNQRILTAGVDQTARLWDATTGQLLHIFQVPTGKVMSAAFSPDDKHILTVTDNTTSEWDATTGQRLRTSHGYTSTIISAVFNQHIQRIVTTSSGNAAAVWDAVTGKLLYKLTGHKSLIRSAHFSLDGQRIVTASDDKTAIVWDATTGAPLCTLQGHTARIWSAAFSPDGQYIATASDDKTAIVWDATTCGLLYKLRGHTDRIWSAGFSPDSQRIVTASADGTARIWANQEAAGHSQLLLTTSQDLTYTLDSAVFSPDGQRILTNRDNGVRLWDAETGKALSVPVNTTDTIASAIFSPNGQYILTRSANSVHLWNARKPLGSSDPLYSFEVPIADSINSAVFITDSNYILTAGFTGTLRIWAPQALFNNDKPLSTIQGYRHSITSAVFSPNGKRVLTVGMGEITATVIDIQDPSRQVQPVLTLKRHTAPVNSAVFSPDGKRIVTASNDQKAIIWDSTTGQALLILQGHTGPVKSAVFSPDGQLVLTASDDRTAIVWDGTTGQALLTLQGHTAAVNSAIFSPDGQRILTASADGTARTWFVSVDAYLAAARRLIQRNPPIFTAAERVQYGLDQ